MPRNNSKALARASRAEKIFQMRLEGMTERAIAAKVGLTAPRIHQILAKAHQQILARSAESLEQTANLDLQRLDELIRVHWPKRADPDRANVVFKAMERRAKLLGLDKPDKSELFGKDGVPLIPPTINIGFKNGGPGKPNPSAEGS
jgi:hypothetical protein